MPYPPWTSVDDAARLLQDGQVVAIPTETVYGLAGNAYNSEALAKIFAAKERPTFDPLIVHIADIAQLQDIAQDIPDAAYRLAEAYWPGPMTLVLPKKDCIPDLCTSGLPSVAVRFPSHPIAQEIIKKSGLPLAAPSANLFKHVSPTTAMHVAEQLSETRSHYRRNGGEGSRQGQAWHFQLQAGPAHDGARAVRYPLQTTGTAILWANNKRLSVANPHSENRIREYGRPRSRDR